MTVLVRKRRQQQESQLPRIIGIPLILTLNSANKITINEDLVLVFRFLSDMVAMEMRFVWCNMDFWDPF